MQADPQGEPYKGGKKEGVVGAEGQWEGNADPLEIFNRPDLVDVEPMAFHDIASRRDVEILQIGMGDSGFDNQCRKNIKEIYCEEGVGTKCLG